MSDKDKPITNTFAKAKTMEGARDFLMEAMFHSAAGGSPSGAIEAQEAAGQRELCGTTTRLPSDFNEYGDGAGKGKAALEAAGVKFLGPVEGDDLFLQVELPPGWKVEPTDHSMWSALKDGHGRKRAGVFYKAAFYDRKAHIHVEARFNVQVDYPEDYKAGGPYVAKVTDGGEKVIWTSPEFHNDEIYQDEEKRKKFMADNGYDALEEIKGERRARKAAREWLNEHYPDWEHLSCYWEES
jgi:hypothetical protein